MSGDDDIHVLREALERKQQECQMAAQIGQQLLAQTKVYEERIASLEESLQVATSSSLVEAQLRQQLADAETEHAQLLAELQEVEQSARMSEDERSRGRQLEAKYAKAHSECEHLRTQLREVETHMEESIRRGSDLEREVLDLQKERDLLQARVAVLEESVAESPKLRADDPDVSAQMLSMVAELDRLERALGAAERERASAVQEVAKWVHELQLSQQEVQEQRQALSDARKRVHALEGQLEQMRADDGDGVGLMSGSLMGSLFDQLSSPRKEHSGDDNEGEEEEETTGESSPISDARVDADTNADDATPTVEESGPVLTHEAIGKVIKLKPDFQRPHVRFPQVLLPSGKRVVVSLGFPDDKLHLMQSIMKPDTLVRFQYAGETPDTGEPLHATYKSIVKGQTWAQVVAAAGYAVKGNGEGDGKPQSQPSQDATPALPMIDDNLSSAFNIALGLTTPIGVPQPQEQPASSALPHSAPTHSTSSFSSNSVDAAFGALLGSSPAVALGTSPPTHRSTGDTAEGERRITAMRKQLTQKDRELRRVKRELDTCASQLRERDAQLAELEGDREHSLREYIQLTISAVRIGLTIQYPDYSDKLAKLDHRALLREAIAKEIAMHQLHGWISQKLKQYLELPEFEHTQSHQGSEPQKPKSALARVLTFFSSGSSPQQQPQLIHVNVEDADMGSWLWYLSSMKRRKSSRMARDVWERRWFVLNLRDDSLSQHTGPGISGAERVIKIRGITSVSPCSAVASQVPLKGGGFMFQITLQSGDVLMLSAETESNMLLWMDALAKRSS